jgi:hypothetical protein
VLKNPWVPCLADNLSNSMVIAATAWEELRHGSVSGTLGFPELARAAGREGDFLFAYWGVAVANRDHRNVYGRSRVTLCRRSWARVLGSAPHADLGAVDVNALTSVLARAGQALGRKCIDGERAQSQCSDP